MKKFLLRMDEELFDKATEYSNEQNMSLNKFINDVLSEKINNLSDSSFETRNIVGTMVKGSSIVEKKELVEVAGIYYKYRLVGEPKISRDSFYEIVKAIGNEIYIKKEETE